MNNELNCDIIITLIELFDVVKKMINYVIPPKFLTSVIRNNLRYCDISDGFSMSVIDINMLDIDYALYERTLHRIYNEIDISILYNDIFNGQ